MTFSASCFDFAQHDLQPGSLSQSGFHFQARADQVCAFADSEQAEVSARGEVCGAIRHLKADTVIADFEFDLLIGKVDVERGVFRLCVAHNIIQRLLRDTVKRQFHFVGKMLFPSRFLELNFQEVGLAGFARQHFERGDTFGRSSR